MPGHPGWATGILGLGGVHRQYNHVLCTRLRLRIFVVLIRWRRGGRRNVRAALLLEHIGRSFIHLLRTAQRAARLAREILGVDVPVETRRSVDLPFLGLGAQFGINASFGTCFHCV
jgi:hypothetical protein